MLQKRTSLASWLLFVCLAAFCLFVFGNTGSAMSNIVPVQAAEEATTANKQAAAVATKSYAVQPQTTSADQALPGANATATRPQQVSLDKAQPSTQVSRSKPAVALVATAPKPAEASVPQQVTIQPSNQLVDTTCAQQGLVVVNYAGERKGKLRIEKDSTQYTYDLFAGSTESVAFPLQLGSGQYTIKVYEHIEGKRYRVAQQEQLQANITQPLNVYLHNIQLINWQANDAPIAKAAQLVQGKATAEQKLAAIHGAVINHIAYDYQKLAEVAAGYIPEVAQVWADGKGICFDYAALMASMLRSQGLPTKLVKGYSPNIKGYHAWNEVYLADEGRWVIVDATYDSQKLAAGQDFDLFKPASQYQKLYEY